MLSGTGAWTEGELRRQRQFLGSQSFTKCFQGSLRGLYGERSGWHVIENKGDSIRVALVHHAVFSLVVEFVHLANFELVGAAINHEAYARIRRDWHMNSVTAVKRWVLIDMRFDVAASQQFCSHRPNDRAARRIVLAKNLVHQRHGNLVQPVPARFFANFRVWPARAICEYEHDGLSLEVHIVG